MRISPKFHINKYRILDVDDLIILKMIGEGHKYVEITRFLNISPPAICHRLKKYELVWEGFSVKTPPGSKRARIMSPAFHEAYGVATRMLTALGEGVEEMLKAS